MQHMEESVQQFLSQPWYLLVFAVIGGAYFVYTNFKEGMDSVNKNDVTYRYAKDSTLTNEQAFALALDAVMTAYWEVDNNTLAFTHNGKKPYHFEKYMDGWFINTKEGYEDLTQYFLEDGRRSYFNFIYPLFKNAPKAEWQAKMAAEYGDNERAYNILARLAEYDVTSALLQNGIISDVKDMEIGVLGWDVSTLIGQARRAYTAGLITEAEAWQTITAAKQMALQHFNSWEDFGRSLVIGMALDYYQQDGTFFEDYIETYHQVAQDTESPWQRMAWGK